MLIVGIIMQPLVIKNLWTKLTSNYHINIYYVAICNGIIILSIFYFIFLSYPLYNPAQNKPEDETI